MENPGRAGITVDRLGDAEKWIPVQQKDQQKGEAIQLMGAVDGSEPQPYDNYPRTWQGTPGTQDEDELVRR
jgi:hypothetical protein